MTISERIAAARRERRVLARVSRAAWRLDQAEWERTWALVSARAEGISIRTLATATGLSPSRVHQIVADADLDAVIAALGELRAAGWPAPEVPDSEEDTDLDGRDHLADRLSDEVDWLRQCAGWLRQLDRGGYPPTVNLGVTRPLRPASSMRHPRLSGAASGNAGFPEADAIMSHLPAETPSTNSSLRLSADRRTASASAYSGESYQRCRWSIAGNSTMTTR